MGSLADLLIASSSDIPAITSSEYPLGTFKGTNVDGLDPLSLAALHVSFSGEDLNQAVEHYKPVAEASPSGPWLIKFPDELVADLANLAPQDHTSMAGKWASTEPLQAEGWSVEDAEGYLGRLTHYAKTAAFDDMEVFLWIYR